MPGGKIDTAADIDTDPYFRDRAMLQTVTLRDGKTFGLPGIVSKLSETPGASEWPVPQLGEHAEEVLETIGISGAELADLRSKGIV